MRKTELIITALFTLLLFAAACTSNTTDADTTPEVDDPSETEVNTITVDNMGATAYVFIGIDGEGASGELNRENAEIELRIGDRFIFDNESGASNHPLDFRNGDRNKLFGQSNADGSFDEDGDVDVVKDGNKISFTLTADLAAELSGYVCSFHPGMNGNIVITDM